MSIKAFVVDDDPDIVEEVEERLRALRHTCDTACSLTEARALFEPQCYQYVLLDMQIPLQYGKKPRVQNGELLLQEIIEADADIPVIVMTGHGLEGPKFAVKLLRNGAVHFVAKPFAPSGEDSLEYAIQSTLKEFNGKPSSKVFAAPNSKKKDKAQSPQELQPFHGGELVFYKNRIELNGIPICTGKKTRIRKILEILRERTHSGSFKGFPGEDLANMIGDNIRGQNSIAEAIKEFRDKLHDLMREAGFLIGRQDVIENKTRGYHFSAKITIRNIVEEDVHAGQVDIKNLNEREKWILEKLHEKYPLQLSHIKNEFGRSNKTAGRDIRSLRDKGVKIGFVGAPKTGHYFLE